MGWCETGGRTRIWKTIPIVLFDVSVVTLVTFREEELLGVNGGGEMMLPLVVVKVEVVVVTPDAPPSPWASPRGTTAARRMRTTLESILFGSCQLLGQSL